MSNQGLQHPTLALLALLVAFPALSARAADVEEALIDPTRPLVLPSVESAEGEADGFEFDFLDEAFTTYELSSVLIRGDVRIAVINGERVRVGERIGSARVATIEADSVRLNVDGDIQTLELYANSIKTLVKGDE